MLGVPKARLRNVVDLRLLLAAAAMGAVTGLILSPVVVDALLRWGVIESVVECVRAPCPYEASTAVGRGIAAACALAGAVFGAAIAAAFSAAGQLTRHDPSVGSCR